MSWPHNMRVNLTAALVAPLAFELRVLGRQAARRATAAR